MRIVITGGAGFIGSNLAAAALQSGDEIGIFDDLSRPGAEQNLAWIRGHGASRLTTVVGDIRSPGSELDTLVAAADVVYHLAGQVSALSSLVNPTKDFEINCVETLNLLEAIRRSAKRPLLVYVSSNKVYGDLNDLRVAEKEGRFELLDLPLGISESRPIDPSTPYGCSKAAADQYVRDYGRVYGLPVVVFRLSAVYGPRQFGTEDQGWVAYIAISAILGRPITRFGSGKQVRDILWIDDVVNALRRVPGRVSQVSGKAYNVGGGPSNALSVWWEFLPRLSAFLGREPEVGSVRPDRPFDQRAYVSDIRAIKQDLGWQPEIPVDEGLRSLFAWVSANRSTLTAASWASNA